MFDIPTLLRDGLKRYAEQGIETGSFLRAVLENDLTQACAKADIANARILVHIVQYVNFKLPYESHGSAAKVSAWLQKGGLGHTDSTL